MSTTDLIFALIHQFPTEGFTIVSGDFGGWQVNTDSVKLWVTALSKEIKMKYCVKLLSKRNTKLTRIKWEPLSYSDMLHRIGSKNDNRKEEKENNRDSSNSEGFKV